MKNYLLAAFVLIMVNTAITQPSKKNDKNPNENTLLESRRNHKQRIQDGIKSGELTKTEAKQLTNLEDKVKQAMYKAKQSDGTINEAERKEIEKMLLDLSKKIEELKQNTEKRKI